MGKSFSFLRGTQAPLQEARAALKFCSSHGADKGACQGKPDRSLSAQCAFFLLRGLALSPLPPRSCARPQAPRQGQARFCPLLPAAAKARAEWALPPAFSVCPACTACTRAPCCPLYRMGESGRQGRCFPSLGKSVLRLWGLH